jgi:hypothetical protein
LLLFALDLAVINAYSSIPDTTNYERLLSEYIAGQTIKHTSAYRVVEVDMSESGVIVYLSGDY